MRIDSIKLTNYKRFGAFEVQLDPQFNLFVGDNASGKTTVLDAITVGLGSWFIGMKGVESIGSIDLAPAKRTSYSALRRYGRSSADGAFTEEGIHVRIQA